MNTGKREEREIESREGSCPAAPPFSSSCFESPQAVCYGKEIKITFAGCPQRIQAGFILTNTGTNTNTPDHAIPSEGRFLGMKKHK